jgi:ABC-2 type transport system permease protein
MFSIILRKEIKSYFRGIGNWVFVLALPILLILLMSSALDGYMSTDFHTFDDGKVYYYYDEKTEAGEQKVVELQTFFKQSTGVALQEISDYKKGVSLVNKSKAFGIVKITSDRMDYYRSPYNETEGGKIVHSLFEQAMKADLSTVADQVHVTELQTAPVDSSSYATFTYLAFVIMFIALMTSHSIHDERTHRTIERIKISKAGLNVLLLSKVVLGLLIGVIQVFTVWGFSKVVLKVNWGGQILIMVAVLFCLAIMSSIFGVVIGMISRNKSIADSTILMTVMLSGYIGGALSPVYLLENANILKQIVKISPLYWCGRSLTSLYVDRIDVNTFTSIGLSLGLTIIFLIIYKLQMKKSHLSVN